MDDSNAAVEYFRTFRDNLNSAIDNGAFTEIAEKEFSQLTPDQKASIDAFLESPEEGTSASDYYRRMFEIFEDHDDDGILESGVYFIITLESYKTPEKDDRKGIHLHTGKEVLIKGKLNNLQRKHFITIALKIKELLDRILG